MRKFMAIVAAVTLALTSSVAWAGNPHFVFVTATVDGNTLIVDGKEAGLGNETQVHIVATADAACVNPGGNKPSADNKQTFSAEGDFPVQNGRAEFSLVLTATFQPDCVPPMTVEWSNLVVTDAEHGVVYP